MFHMIGKLLCKIGFHNWIHERVYLPSIYAKIVTRFSLIKTCKRCGKRIILVDYHYDPKTGEPV